MESLRAYLRKRESVKVKEIEKEKNKYYILTRVGIKSANKISNFSNFLYIFFLFFVNFENLTVKLYAHYVFNMNIKFYSNWILFIIRSINLFFIHNFRS